MLECWSIICIYGDRIAILKKYIIVFIYSYFVCFDRYIPKREALSSYLDKSKNISAISSAFIGPTGVTLLL